MSCAESGGDEEIERSPESSSSHADASTSGAPADSDASTSGAPSNFADAALTPFAPGADASSDNAPDGAPDPARTVPDASAPTGDAGSALGGDGLEDLLDGLTGGATSTGSWKLDDGSPEECPAEPPPLPIIGGPCLGIYFICNWSDPSGATYTCTCDWVHWLCI